MGLLKIENVLRYGRLHWYGNLQHVEAWPRKVEKRIVPSNDPGSCPGKISLGCIRNDLKLKDLYALLPLFVTVAMSKNFPMFL